MENKSAGQLGRGFWTATAILAVLSLIASWYWITQPLTSVMPEVGAQPGQDVDILFRFMAVVGSVLMIFVGGYLIYFSFAFRRKATDSPDAIGVQVHDNHKLELWWTIFPTVLVVILSVWSTQVWARIQLGQPENGLVVESIGHQWYFTFRYPEIHGEVKGVMHLPVNTPVVLNTTSTDVIHSFWVPAFRLKADMIPGMINTIRFTPTVPGKYPIVCTEFCGTNHGYMNAQVPGPNGQANPGAQFVVVDSVPDFKKWYHAQQVANANESDEIPTASTGTINLAGGDAKAGAALFQTKCSACHAMAAFDKRIVGPGLKGVMADSAHPKLVDGDDATPANVAKILQQGYKGDMGQMPNAVQNGISDKDIANLVAYLSSMK